MSTSRRTWFIFIGVDVVDDESVWFQRRLYSVFINDRGFRFVDFCLRGGNVVVLARRTAGGCGDDGSSFLRRSLNSNKKDGVRNLTSNQCYHPNDNILNLLNNYLIIEHKVDQFGP